MESSTVSDYMTTNMVSMDSNDSILDIAQRMVERNISSVAITDDKERIVGILTERDIVKIVSNRVPAGGITAGSLMSHPLLTVRMGSPINDAARIMAQKKMRHLLVKDGNEDIVGIITVTDLARYLKKNFADEDLTGSEVWELFF